MPKRGKRYTDAKAKLSTGEKLPPQDAIQVVKDLSFAKFDETVEVAARLGVDPRQADHAPIGKVSFDEEKLSDNLEAFMDSIIRARPASSKGTYLRGVSISSTQGPGVAIDPNLYRRSV